MHPWINKSPYLAILDEVARSEFCKFCGITRVNRVDTFSRKSFVTEAQIFNYVCIYFVSKLLTWWPSLNIALVFLSVFNRASSGLQWIKKLYLWQPQFPCTVQCGPLILCGSNPVAQLLTFLTAPSSFELFEWH